MPDDRTTAPWPSAFFELSGEYISLDRHKGQTSWYVRGQDVVTVVTWAAEGEVLREPAAPDEHAVLVPEGGAAEVRRDGDDRVDVVGPALVVAPPGDVDVTVGRAGFMVRVFTARSGVAATAINHATYAAADTRGGSSPAAPAPARPGRLRALPLAGETATPGLDQVYRTDSLMIRWCAPEEGPRDTDDLAPIRHDDVEHAVLTLAGDHVHHVRWPWTTRMRDWHPDEHVQVTSPSVTLMAPGNVHTTRAVGPGRHQMIDVSAPSRSGFLELGPPRNQADYEFGEGD